jgi:hypothetical protein
MCGQLLANPVIEDFEIASVSAGAPATAPATAAGSAA